MPDSIDIEKRVKDLIEHQHVTNTKQLAAILLKRFGTDHPDIGSSPTEYIHLVESVKEANPELVERAETSDHESSKTRRVGHRASTPCPDDEQEHSEGADNSQTETTEETIEFTFAETSLV